jgi:hypothetical protein
MSRNLLIIAFIGVSILGGARAYDFCATEYQNCIINGDDCRNNYQSMIYCSTMNQVCNSSSPLYRNFSIDSNGADNPTNQRKNFKNFVGTCYLPCLSGNSTNASIITPYGTNFFVTPNSDFNILLDCYATLVNKSEILKFEMLSLLIIFAIASFL